MGEAREVQAATACCAQWCKQALTQASESFGMGQNATNFSSTGSCPFPLLPVVQAVVASQSPAHLVLACRAGAGTVPAAYSSCSSKLRLEQGLTWRHSLMG